MDNFNLMPTASQPVNRITTGQLPTELAELSEEDLTAVVDGASVLPAQMLDDRDIYCSYDGDDTE